MKFFVLKTLSTLLFFLFLSSEIKATNYYFSTMYGDDSRMSIEARNPNTPWKTLTKFNEISGSLSPGDTVLFRCGEKFFGQLILKKSGTQQRPIVITSYGTGVAPEISGWISLESSDSDVESILRYDLKDIKLSSPDTVKTVLVDGELREKGRYPNDGYLTYNSVGKGNHILYKNMPDISRFDQAEIVLRMNEWIFDKARIDNLSAQGVSFLKETDYDPTDQYGFFIQDHFNTLDRHGEWFHDRQTNSLFIYSGKENDQKLNVKISAVDYLLTNENRIKHVKVEGIDFSGSTKSAIFLEQGEHISLINCKIESAGEDGIKVINVANMTISGNTISNTFDNGIFLRYGTPNSIIANNKISNVNLYPGMSKSGDQTGVGIYSRSDSTYISSNVLTNIGYSGIFFGGNHTIVEKNSIDGYCLIKNDGGGIYTFEGKRNQSYQNRIVRSNTIINGKGTRQGNKFSNSIENPQVEGIYIDDNASGIVISNNIIGIVSRNGINLHNARDISLNKNTIFNCASSLSFSHDNHGDPLGNVSVSENRLIAIKDNQKSIKLTSKLMNLLEEITFENNTYHHPASNNFIFQLNDLNLSFNEWSFYEPSHKAKPLISQDLANIAFEEVNLKRHNLLDNLPKKINPLNNDCKIKTDNDRLKVITNEPMSGIRIELAEISNKKNYLLKMTAQAESNVIIQAYLRTAGSPWSTVSEIQAFAISPKNEENLIIFSNVLSTVNPVLMLKVENKVGIVNISELIWTETIPPKATPTFNLKLNDSNLIEEIQFDGNIFYLKD